MTNANFAPGTHVRANGQWGVVAHKRGDTHGILVDGFPQIMIARDKDTSYLGEPNYWYGDHAVRFGDVVSDDHGNQFVYMGKEDGLHKAVPFGQDTPESLYEIYSQHRKSEEGSGTKLTTVPCTSMVIVMAACLAIISVAM